MVAAALKRMLRYREFCAKFVTQMKDPKQKAEWDKGFGGTPRESERIRAATCDSRARVEGPKKTLLSRST